MIEKVISFLKEFNYEDIPEVSKDNAARSFLDIIGVSASATKTELSKIIRTHSSEFYSHNPKTGLPSSIWFDGTKVNAIGAREKVKVIIEISLKILLNLYLFYKYK